MADTAVTVSYNNGSPTIDQDGTLSLNYGDTVSLSLLGFPQASAISSVGFFENEVVRGVDQKSATSVGDWSIEGGNSSNLTVYSCTGDDDGGVVIEDIENKDDDDKYWYGISIDGPGGPWGVDPELINKGKGGGG